MITEITDQLEQSLKEEGYFSLQEYKSWGDYDFRVKETFWNALFARTIPNPDFCTKAMHCFMKLGIYANPMIDHIKSLKLPNNYYNLVYCPGGVGAIPFIDGYEAWSNDLEPEEYQEVDFEVNLSFFDGYDYGYGNRELSCFPLYDEKTLMDFIQEYDSCFPRLQQIGASVITEYKSDILRHEIRSTVVKNRVKSFDCASFVPEFHFRGHDLTELRFTYDHFTYTYDITDDNIDDVCNRLEKRIPEII